MTVVTLMVAAAVAAADKEPPAYHTAKYVKPESFTEREVTVGTGEWKLPGTLSVPKGPGPFPAVVLVHGSGPLDRDETVFVNKPFRDLAGGLASRGVAVLRYEKRTRAHGKAMVEKGVAITVENETVADAVLAVKLLRGEKDIDPKRVFVLGHSLGGYVGPQIAARAEGVAGLIVLAGNTRPLEDLVLEQYEYLVPLQEKDADKQKAILDPVRAKVARVKGDGLTKDTPAKNLPLGLPAEYWLALRGYDPAKAAAGLKRPLLILQGERDYQVTMADFAGWKKGLEGRTDVTTKSYPELNHLFHAGEGQSKPAEYLFPKNVAEVVIDDVAAWVKSARESGGNGGGPR